MIRGLIHRRFCSHKLKPPRIWPHIERPSLTQALSSAMKNPSGGFYLLNGGKGSGKSDALYRVATKGKQSPQSMSNIAIIVDFERVDHCRESEDLVAWIVQQISRQLSLQLDSSRIMMLCLENCPDFGERFNSFISKKPLWNHLTKSCKSVEEAWHRVMTSQPTVAEVLPQLRLATLPQDELGLYIELLKSAKMPVSMCLLHTERVGSSSGSLGPLMNPSFNVIVECNDPLMSIWTVCGGDSNREWNVIEVNDLPLEAVNAVFVPSLLSDSIQANTLYEICGGRVGLLEKLFVPLTTLREQQKLRDMDQEQRYRAGKENRPSSESKELQVDPLVYQRDVVLRDSLVEGVLNEQTHSFSNAMDTLLNQTAALSSYRVSLSPIEYRVFVMESLKQLADKIQSQGSIPLPATLSPMDIAHPVILGMMECGLLMVRWVPFTRIVIANPSTLVQIEAWCNSQLEDLSIPDRVAYNVIAKRNRIHLDRQLDKLGA